MAAPTISATPKKPLISGRPPDMTMPIHPKLFPEYTTQTPYVYTSVQIDWSRFLGYRTITEFLDSIASHVTNPNPKSDEYVSARQGIQAALTEMLWSKYAISELTAFSRMRRTWTGAN